MSEKAPGSRTEHHHYATEGEAFAAFWHVMSGVMAEAVNNGWDVEAAAERARSHRCAVINFRPPACEPGGLSVQPLRDTPYNVA